MSSGHPHASSNAPVLPQIVSEGAGTGLVSHNDAPVDPKALQIAAPHAGAPREVGGRGGLEPTRYGDWEKNGRCIDF